MKRVIDQDQERTFTRRALILGGGKLALLGALVSRLYYLQIVDADRYRTLSEDNQFNLELLAPIRGRIFDRNGLALADNQDNFRIEIVKEQTSDPSETLRALGTVIEISKYDVTRVLREMRRKRNFVPITVVENLTREDISRVAVNTPYLPGVRIEVGRTRRYPHADKIAHVTGYVAAVSDSELTGDPVLELPDFRIGKAGMEKLFDEDMRGQAGQRQVEVNALGRIIRKLPGQEGQPGRDMTLTIDMRLQEFTSKRLARANAREVPLDHPDAVAALAGLAEEERSITVDDTVYLDKKGKAVPGESGAAVIMDVHSGEVLTLSSVPAYDPNGFNKGLSARDWEDLLSNPRSPLTNKAIAGQYPPGSTFKMVVALAALEAGLAGPGTEVNCIGHMELGKGRFHCWKKWGHGTLNMVQALEQSCDIYFYEMAKRVGIHRIQAMARRMGLGERTRVELNGERRGLVPSKEWKLATRGERWQLGETVISGIGQGFLLATPLQLALMTARLANGGVLVKPTLVREQGEIQEPASLKINPASLKVVLEGMNAAVNGARGTAKKAAPKGVDYKLAGKTGTAQVRRITRSERLSGVVKNEDLPWRERDHALFVAFAPYDAPRYATAVVIEHGGSASRVAAPIARDILAKTMRLDPSRTAGARAGGPEATNPNATNPNAVDPAAAVSRRRV